MLKRSDACIVHAAAPACGAPAPQPRSGLRREPSARAWQTAAAKGAAGRARVALEPVQLFKSLFCLVRGKKEGMTWHETAART
jgi:hypothetical protein